MCYVKLIDQVPMKGFLEDKSINMMWLVLCMTLTCTDSSRRDVCGCKQGQRRRGAHHAVVMGGADAETADGV